MIDAKVLLDVLVDRYGARFIAESLVEVFHDRAGDGAKGNRSNEQLRWLRLGTALGNVVHFRNLEWPS